MIRFIVKRSAALLLTMMMVSIMVFAAFEWTPGQVATKILGPFSTQDQRDLLTEQLGLNQGVAERYLHWLTNVLSGDLGYSTLYKAPVNDVIWGRLANTLVLAAAAFAIVVPLSVLLGVAAGMREGSWLDRTISVSSIVATSVPEFASGVFLVSIFVFWLGWLPGTSSLDVGSGSAMAMQLILPITVIVLYDLGYLVRIVRASVVEVMTKPYVRTAILKGLSFRRVVAVHALRNAMIAPFTVILLQINYMITGVVVVEAVFAYPGFGRMLLEAALAQDVATVQAAALLAVFITVFTQIAGDLGFMFLNPRIRFS